MKTTGRIFVALVINYFVTDSGSQPIIWGLHGGLVYGALEVFLWLLRNNQEQ